MDIFCNSFEETKAKAVELMKNPKVKNVYIGRKRVTKQWFVNYVEFSEEYYNTVCKNSLTNE